VISNLAGAARLMGTPTIICGLSPEIAMTLQTMGVELQSVRTALSLEQALGMLGLEVRRAEEEDEDTDDAGGWQPAQLTDLDSAQPRKRGTSSQS
jgi:rsbT antagonist protein RsbS